VGLIDSAHPPAAELFPDAVTIVEQGVRF